jgi:thioglycine synthase
MPDITLQKCPKVYILETHRSRAPESTLQFIENTKELVGIKSLRNVTDLDRIGLPVFTCDRIRPDGSKTSHTGKGISNTQALVSLMMEAIERYCSEFRDEYVDGLVRGSYEGLRGAFHILNPQELILPDFSDFHREAVLHWVWGFDLNARKEILVPASAVYHPFSLDETGTVRTHTNGLASGNTLEEAIFHGMTEVIERDAWSIAKFNDEMNAALVVEDGSEHRFILDLIRKFEDAAVEVTARDLTTDIGVPVIAAFSQDGVYPNLMPFDGFGAHLDPRVAMARALLELATTRAFFIQKHGIGGLQENVPYYYSEADLEDPRFYAHEWRRLGEMQSRYSTDILDDVHTLLNKLEMHGLKQTVVVDLTRPDVGIPVVRVIIPGMEVYCFDRERKGQRLFESGCT